MEATEAMEPTEPTDRIEPVELTDRIDPVELTDRSERDGGAVTPPSCPPDAGHGDGQAAAVLTGRPSGVSTYQRPPALVRAWPVAMPGSRSGGHR